MPLFTADPIVTLVIESGVVLIPATAYLGWLAARGARALRDRHGYRPDVIVGHSGWGETLFLREIWPEARLLVYAELMYRTQGQDVGFDPEISPGTDEARVSTVARSAHLIQAMLQADAGLCPTRYQADSFPPELRRKLTVIHDGIDTARVRPDPSATVTLPNGVRLRPGDEVVTYVARNLEPYRGFHTFMRALPDLLAARPRATVLVVGGDDVSYGRRLPPGESYRARMLAEVKLPPGRVHFLGQIAYADYLRVLQISAAHVYLTYPFVLSWSLLGAMALERPLVLSDTGPVRDFFDGEAGGLLVDFFDAQGLAERLVHLAGQPAQRERLGRRARELLFAHELTREHGRRKWLDLILSL